MSVTSDPRSEHDRESFRKVVRVTLVWLVLLLLAGLFLIFFGDGLTSLFM